MRRRGVLAAGVCLLVGGCASHPARPTPPDASATAAADPLQGCSVLFERRQPASYVLRCGGLLAAARRVSGTGSPATEVRDEIDGLAAVAKGHAVGIHATRPLMLAGRSRPVTAFTVAFQRGGAVRRWQGRASGWQSGRATITVVTCGAPSGADPRPCTGVLGWLATHAAPPARLPRSRLPAAKPHPARDVTEVLDAFPGCTGLALDTGEIRLRCGDAGLVLRRLEGHPGPGPALPVLLRKIVVRVLARIRAGGHPDATWQPLDCHVAGKVGACARIDLHGPHPAQEILAGLGPVSGTLTMVMCTEPAGDAGHGGCIRVLKVAP